MSMRCCFLLCVVAVGTITRTVKAGIPSESRQLPPSCDSSIYCQGKLLETVQMARIFDDSKTFVDMSMLQSEEDTLNNFDIMMNESGSKPTEAEIKNFVEKHFVSENELDNWIPEDFVEEPTFLSKINNTDVRQFAKNLIGIWKELGRKVKSDVIQHPKRYSLIPVPNGFIIPGGRFREYYYWDSYWILEGLIHSEMIDTTRHIVDNFLSIVKRFGFIPNGGRVYYTQRSQPPMLSFMAKKYVDVSGNLTWLKDNIAIIDKEVEFWINERMHKVRYQNQAYELGFYVCRSKGPRPESYWEDYMTANFSDTEIRKQKLYDELKAGAQSGWDFSSRWIFDENGGTNANLSSIHTTRVAPVDLNAYLYGAFRHMAHFYSLLKDTKKVAYWNIKAVALLDALKNVFWDEKDGIWYDFDIQMGKRRKFYAGSNLTPLWVNAYHAKDKQIEQVMEYLVREGIANYPGGIPVTKLYTGEQWDFPTAFPNIQSVIVQGLEQSCNSKAQKMARTFAEKWVEAMMIGYKNSNAMYEKYDVTNPGHRGGGGEYAVQKGFGWTNGVTLDFIHKYYVADNNK